MKIPLEEAYKKATPGPLRVVLEPQGVKCLDGSELVTKHWLRPANSEWSVADVYATKGRATHPGMQGANAAILAHAFNVLPEILNAWKDMIGSVGSITCLSDHYDDIFPAKLKALEDAIAKASTVEVPE